MRSYRWKVVTAVTTALALAVAGCADPEPTAGPAPELAEPDTVLLYGTDGTMQNSFADGLADRSVLDGMKGTAPLNPLPAEFTNRLREVDDSLTGYLFAGETYDAVAISAIAAELAGTPDPVVVRDYITGVTNGSEECQTVADCLRLARNGTQPAYRGIALQSGGFTERGEPAAATYATQHFGPDGVIEEAKTEYVGAGDVVPATGGELAAPADRDAADGDPEPLKIGGLLPETGALSFAYPPMIAAARLAIQDINQAGGVFDEEVEWVDGDDGTDPAVARATLAAHVEEGVHIIIGAAASDVTKEILPDAVAAQRILFSPSNTAAELSSAEHDGFYFRTAPSDVLQGEALANIILRDGVERVVIVTRDDAYGRGLQGDVAEALRQFGMPESGIRELPYQLPEEEGGPVPGLDQLAEQVVAADPEGVVVIGFSEAAQVIERMVAAGLRLHS